MTLSVVVNYYKIILPRLDGFRIFWLTFSVDGINEIISKNPHSFWSILRFFIMVKHVFFSVSDLTRLVFRDPSSTRWIWRSIMWSFNGPLWPSYLDEQQQGVTGVTVVWELVGSYYLGNMLSRKEYGCWTKNSGTPKWMVYFMENPIKMDDLGVPLFLETPICFFQVNMYF